MQTAYIPTQEAMERAYGSASACLQSQARIARTALLEANGAISVMVEAWLLDDELSPATVRKRLNCLSRMGVDVQGHRPALSKAPKWWLRPSQERDIMLHGLVPPILKLYIKWATRTGLRVEESLRLTPEMIQGGIVHVPGTKTALSAAPLPIHVETEQVLREAMALSGGNPFPMSYDTLHDMWQYAREVIGAHDDPTATLKALRRNAARYLHVDRGMPLDMVRQYLRHAHIDTTLGYLHLTGGYGENEMRRYL